MRWVAAKKRSLFSLAALCVLAGTLVAPAPALATRTFAGANGRLPAPTPDFDQVLAQHAGPTGEHVDRLPLYTTLDVVTLAFCSALEADQVEATVARQRHRLHLLSSQLARSDELEWGRKTATGVSSWSGERNYKDWSYLERKTHRPSYQGLWTDPVTGIAYARNRWYDMRSASWLSEDPKGDVDSPNLYAGFAWMPHMMTDPLGRNVVDPDLVLNPQYRHFEFEGSIYGVSPTTLAVGLQTPAGYRTLSPGDAADAETIAVIQSMYMGGVSLPANYQMVKVLQGVNRKLTEEEFRQTESDLIGITPIAGDIQDFAIVWSGVNPITGEELGPWGYGLTVVAAALPVVSGHTVARILGKGADEVLDVGANLGRRDVPRFRIVDEAGRPFIEIDPRGRGSIYRDPATGRWTKVPDELQGMPPESQWISSTRDVTEETARMREAMEAYDNLQAATDASSLEDALVKAAADIVKKKKR
jgi:RHS repeat-associated protein